MRVLALSSQKGGSGKTTLSGHLAVQAQRAGFGPVCLIDIDPQGSLADWWNEREDEMPAFAQTTVARLGADLEVLRQQGFQPRASEVHPAILRPPRQSSQLGTPREIPPLSAAEAPRDAPTERHARMTCIATTVVRQMLRDSLIECGGSEQ